MLERIKEAADYISKQCKNKAEIAIILGSGLGGLADKIDIEKSIPYISIPGFPVSTVEGHDGRLILGKIGNTQILAMKGRFHYYEGYPMDIVTFPIRVMKLAGIKTLIISNASGGLNTNFEIGDIMFINDHINLMPNPLIGQTLATLEPGFRI